MERSCTMSASNTTATVTSVKPHVLSVETGDRNALGSDSDSDTDTDSGGGGGEERGGPELDGGRILPGNSATSKFGSASTIGAAVFLGKTRLLHQDAAGPMQVSENSWAYNYFTCIFFFCYKVIRFWGM